VGTLNVGGEGMSVLGMLSFCIEKNGMSGTLMSGTGKMTVSGTTLTSFERMLPLNVGGEGTPVLGMPSFGIEKNSMSRSLMSRTSKTTALGTTLTSLGRMWWGTTARRQQCPILALTLTPPRRAVVDINDNRYRRSQRLPSPLPRSTTTTAKSQWLSFVIVNGGDDKHRRLQRRWMAAMVMTSLPPPSTTTTGWWPTARCCRHRRSRHRCCRHHALALASAITIAAAFAIVIAPPTLLSMVGCCVICRPLPAALSAVQICQPPPSCGASLMHFLLGRHPLLLTITSRCLSLFY
jgi:hypothetical protein